MEINWWLEITKIAIPSLVALITPLVVYGWLAKKMKEYENSLSTDLKAYESALNRKLEEYRNNLNKELESHKVQLQSDFQTKFYEFQTRYSLIHQKKAEAIEQLFELLAKVQIDIQTWMAWDGISRLETKEEFLLRTKEHFQNLTDFFDKKRIYFDKDIKEEVLKFVSTAAAIIPRYDQFNIAEFVKVIHQGNISEGIHRTMEKLEEKFKKLLSADNPNYQAKKNND